MLGRAISKEEIFKVVMQQLCEVVPELEGRPIKGSDSLRDLGANSMDRADIVMGVMDSFAMKVPRAELSGARNIDELVDVIHAKLQ